MSQSIWKCTQTIKMEDDGTVAFTEGQLYRGEPSATSSGEWAMSFTDDQNQEHLILSDWLHKHFVKVEPLEAQAT